MKRSVEDWTIETVSKRRAQISFPDYQRQPRLWSEDQKRLLIDSILRDIDIPKLYFNRVDKDSYEVVDGQQRLWAIWDYLDDQYPYKVDGKAKEFSALTSAQKAAIKGYKLQITVFNNADNDYLRELFLRLQLGLLLITGEKLNAATGRMRDWIFKKAVNKTLIKHVGVPVRRFSKETLCAQIAINSFTRAKTKDFARTRYEDLLQFFKDYETPQGQDLELFEEQRRRIEDVMELLWECLGVQVKDLRSRSYLLSIYLHAEERQGDLATDQAKRKYGEFGFTLWKRLKEEIKAGMDRNNREIYSFENLLSSAPTEKYQIQRRHDKMVEYYAHFLKTGKIKGDK